MNPSRVLPVSVAPADLRVTVVSVAREVWGSERSVLNLAPLLARRGVDLTVAAPEGDFLSASAAAGLRTRVLRVPRHAGVVDTAPTRLRSVVNAGRELAVLARGVRAVRAVTADADVVHCNSLLATIDCALAARTAGRPAVIEMHDLVRPGISRHLLSAGVVLAGRGIAVSTAVGASVDRFAAGRVVDIAQGVDTDQFSPGPADPSVRRALTDFPDELVFVVLGRIDPEKGVHRVVKAVAELNDTGRRCSLAVVGAPSANNGLYAETTARLARDRLGDRVRFVQTRPDVADVLRAADVLVNASDAEPFGLSVLEAQACEVAVVASSTGGLRDFVADGRTGRTFAPGDAAALVAALADVADDPGLRSRLAGRALSQVHARYTLGRRADAMVSLYREAAGRPAPARAIDAVAA